MCCYWTKYKLHVWLRSIIPGFKLNKNKSFALQYALTKHNTRSTDVSETTKQYGKYAYPSETKLYTSVYFDTDIDILVNCN